jgi:hypothetical protein
MCRFVAQLRVWHRPCTPGGTSDNHPRRTTMKSTMLAVALMVVLVGLAACAKYPVVVNASAPAPTAAAPAPTR